jgi:peptidoglycan/LPS O-acetylase OafA/YrhL
VPAARRAHLYPVDLFRVVTFAGVVAVHSLGLTAPASVGVQAVVVALHYTREGFFFLMALVLFYTYYDRTITAVSFWRRRFPPILVPYVVWTVIYVWVDHVSDHLDAVATLRDLGQTLLVGHFQMYFLVVSLQLYAIFPAFAWLLRRTAGYHWRLVAISGALELLTMTLIHLNDSPPPPAFAGWLVNGALRIFATYQFYLVAGAVIAVHLDEVTSWLATHRSTVAASALAGLAIAEGAYFWTLHAGGSIGHAADVLQPSMVVWNITWALALYRLGLVWARRRRAGSRTSRLIAEGSDISFGVYLCHALVLFTILPLIPGFTAMPNPALTIVTLLATLAISAAFASLALRTPLARFLCGRPMKGWRRH